jgi:hypothetical protein
MKHAGDFTPGKTVVIRFNSHKADGTPATLSGTPAISVYKNSTTESTSGVTLTVDYDSRTGLNHVAVDTSADGTFYAAGNDFDLVITAGTVDSISVVGTVVGGFSLSNRSALRPATAGRTLVVDAAGLADANTVKLGPSGSGTAQTARDIGASVLLSSGTGTGQLDFTSGVVKSNLAQILGTVLTETAGQIAAAFKKFFNVATPTGTLKALQPSVVWTVASSGGDYTAISDAVSAATSGDTIFIKAGTYSGAVDASSKSLTFMGEGAGSIITHNSGDTLKLGDFSTVDMLTVNATGTSNSDTAISCDSKAGVCIRRCFINGKYDAVRADSSYGFELTQCVITGTFDGVRLDSAVAFRVEGNSISTDSTWAAGAQETRALVIFSTLLLSSGVVRNNYLYAQRDTDNAFRTMAAASDGQVTFEGNTFVVLVTAGSSTAAGFGYTNTTPALAGTAQNDLAGNRFVVIQQGAGASYDIDASSSNGAMADRGGNLYSLARVNGTAPVVVKADTRAQAAISSLDATGVRSALGLASANLDVQLGGVATDAGEANTQATSAATNALTAASKATAIEADYARRTDKVTLAAAQTDYAPQTATQAATDKTAVLDAIDGIEAGGGGSNPVIIKADEVEIR